MRAFTIIDRRRVKGSCSLSLGLNSLAGARERASEEAKAKQALCSRKRGRGSDVERKKRRGEEEEEE